MDLWLQAEARARREELYAVARLARLIRLAESGRSTGFRCRIANGAHALSVAPAHLAQTLREQPRV